MLHVAEIVGARAPRVYKRDGRVRLMRNAVRRRERPFKIQPASNGKGKILRFERRERVIPMANDGMPVKSRGCARLVRDLLIF